MIWSDFFLMLRKSFTNQNVNLFEDVWVCIFLKTFHNFKKIFHFQSFFTISFFKPSPLWNVSCSAYFELQTAFKLSIRSQSFDSFSFYSALWYLFDVFHISQFYFSFILFSVLFWVYNECVLCSNWLSHDLWGHPLILFCLSAFLKTFVLVSLYIHCFTSNAQIKHQGGRKFLLLPVF